MNVIDSHCHLDMVSGFERDPLDALVEAKKMGISGVLQIAVSLESSGRNIELCNDLRKRGAETIPDLQWSAGIHPESVAPDDKSDELMSFFKQKMDDVYPPIAIGETGLDYFQNPESAELQRERLSMHLDIAEEFDLPIILHLRDDRFFNPDKLSAWNDAYTMVKKRSRIRGVLHCFTYGYEQAAPFVDLGWTVSYSGIVTYKNAGKVKDGVERLPLESIIVETDAPFLAPVPVRGKTNEPAYVKHTVEFIASLRADVHGENPETVKETVFNNTTKLFRWNLHA